MTHVALPERAGMLFEKEDFRFLILAFGYYVFYYYFLGGKDFKKKNILDGLRVTPRYRTYSGRRLERVESQEVISYL